MDWDAWHAVLFDLDGVVTPTAEVHMHAWDAMFNAFLERHAAQTGVEHPPYTEQDYFDHVDGKPRYDGVRSFLSSRGITLPEGTPDDPPTAETVCGLGNRKNDYFEQVLTAEGVVPYPGSVRLIEELHARKVPMAVVSSSRNAPAVLTAAGLIDYFPLIVHGGHTARELGATNDKAVVLEDAISGVAAGRAGAFGLVIGVDRGAGAEALTDAGADTVVTDLAELLDGTDATTETPR